MASSRNSLYLNLQSFHKFKLFLILLNPGNWRVQKHQDWRSIDSMLGTGICLRILHFLELFFSLFICCEHPSRKMTEISQVLYFLIFFLLQKWSRPIREKSGNIKKHILILSFLSHSFQVVDSFFSQFFNVTESVE